MEKGWPRIDSGVTLNLLQIKENKVITQKVQPKGILQETPTHPTNLGSFPH